MSDANKNDDVIDLFGKEATQGVGEIFASTFVTKKPTLELLEQVAAKNKHLLMSKWGYEEYEVAVREVPDLVIYEARMIEALEDLEAIRKIRESNDQLPILVLSDHDDIDYMLAFFQAGATVYCSSKSDQRIVFEQIHSLYKIAQAGRLLAIENQLLKSKLNPKKA